MSTEYKTSLENRVLALEEFIQQDPGKRGLANWAIQNSLYPAAVSLYEGRHIIITTGFYILSAGAIETDGPAGAVILANSLTLIGKEVTIIVDDHSKEIMEESLSLLGCNAELICLNPSEEIIESKIFRDNTTHFVALERPGVAYDGKHHNFRGLVISDFVSNTDSLYLKCKDRGITTVGIGDGGNELGMGNVSENVVESMKLDYAFSCEIESDYCVCAGVSNWGGYAFSGVLSLLSSNNLLPTFNTFRALLDVIVLNGGVDGISGKNIPTVDGLPESVENDIFNYVESFVGVY